MAGQFVDAADKAYDRNVRILHKAVRLTAAFLLLFIGAEIATCELPSSPCSILTIEANGVDHKVAPSKHEASSPTLDDNCICCCAHPVIQPMLAVAPVRLLIPRPSFEKADDPTLFPSTIEHPPQRS